MANANENKENKEEPAFVAFWRPDDPNGYLGQWEESTFIFSAAAFDAMPPNLKRMSLCVERPEIIEKMYGKYYCAEQFMMFGKAMLFGDAEMGEKIMRTRKAKTMKGCGQRVKLFNKAVWDRYCMDIVTIGNWLKFTQNADLAAQLIETGNATLVEGSPIDFIWGVGLRFDDSRIKKPAAWKGTNYLGKVLMVVRRELIALAKAAE